MESPRAEVQRRLRHDVRNTVAVVAGRVEMLSSGLLGPVTDAQRRSLDLLTGSIERLLGELEELARLLDAPDPET